VILGVSFINLTVIISELGIPRRLINFSVRGSQKLLSFLFNPIKFTSNVFSDMLKVFQENILLSGILFLIAFSFSEIIGNI